MIFSMKSRVTYVIDRKVLTTPNGDLLWSFVLGLHREIVEVSSEVIIGS